MKTAANSGIHYGIHRLQRDPLIYLKYKELKRQLRFRPRPYWHNLNLYCQTEFFLIGLHGFWMALLLSLYPELYESSCTHQWLEVNKPTLSLVNARDEYARWKKDFVYLLTTSGEVIDRFIEEKVLPMSSSESIQSFLILLNLSC